MSKYGYRLRSYSQAQGKAVQLRVPPLIRKADLARIYSGAELRLPRKPSFRVQTRAKLQAPNPPPKKEEEDCTLEPTVRQDEAESSEPTQGRPLQNDLSDFEDTFLSKFQNVAVRLPEIQSQLSLVEEEQLPLEQLLQRYKQQRAEYLGDPCAVRLKRVRQAAQAVLSAQARLGVSPKVGLQGIQHNYQLGLVRKYTLLQNYILQQKPKQEAHEQLALATCKLQYPARTLLKYLALRDFNSLMRLFQDCFLTKDCAYNLRFWKDQCWEASLIYFPEKLCPSADCELWPFLLEQMLTEQDIPSCGLKLMAHRLLGCSVQVIVLQPDFKRQLVALCRAVYLQYYVLAVSEECDCIQELVDIVQTKNGSQEDCLVLVRNLYSMRQRWLTWCAFTRQFSEVLVCRYRPNWHHLRLRAVRSSELKLYFQIKFQITVKTKVIFLFGSSEEQESYATLYRERSADFYTRCAKARIRDSAFLEEELTEGRHLLYLEMGSPQLEVELWSQQQVRVESQASVSQIGVGLAKGSAWRSPRQLLARKDYLRRMVEK